LSGAENRYQRISPRFSSRRAMLRRSRAVPGGRSAPIHEAAGIARLREARCLRRASVRASLVRVARRDEGQVRPARWSFREGHP
jgi:hypothetical protein